MLDLKTSRTDGLIAQSVTTDEPKSVVLGSNPIQATLSHTIFL